MIKKISFIIFTFLEFLNKILLILTKKNFLIYFNEFFNKKSYQHINILNKKINFFVPNHITKWRVDLFYSLEPETLDWINNFKKKNLIFWDIGANIGLYSIYNALKNKNSCTYSIEPSTSNLRVLSRNISINNLQNKIKILPIALTNSKNKFLIMNENDFVEGGALNSYGKSFNHEGKKFKSKMKYNIYGTSVEYLLKNKILKTPNFIKIDVDGFEHLILEGFGKYLKNKKIKSLSIEINENYEEQYNKVLKIMKKNKFKILNKKNNQELTSKGSEFAKTFNYIFVR